jgi:hypothetical protein
MLIHAFCAALCTFFSDMACGVLFLTLSAYVRRRRRRPLGFTSAKPTPTPTTAAAVAAEEEEVSVSLVVATCLAGAFVLFILLRLIYSWCVLQTRELLYALQSAHALCRMLLAGKCRSICDFSQAASRRDRFERLLLLTLLFQLSRSCSLHRSPSIFAVTAGARTTNVA